MLIGAIHSRYPIVALMSNDGNLAQIVYLAVEIPWRLERHFPDGPVLEFSSPASVRLLVFDDEAVRDRDRGALLAQIRHDLNQATLLYVAGNYTIENERRARTEGAQYYTAKPILGDEFTVALKGFMSCIHR